MLKTLRSPDYNFVFNDEDGFFARWGKTLEDDPEYSPFGPEILDLEISTICSKGCSWCYKSNKRQGRNMSFETFKIILDKMPKHLTQIALGIGDIDANPDLWRMMEYCRANNVVPNITINGERMTSGLYDLLAELCGAVAVSLYSKDTCYTAVQELTSRGLSQTNTHVLLSQETLPLCHEVLYDRTIDPRLKNLNAVVFLWLKPKGDRNHYHQVEKMSDLKQLISLAQQTGKFGFDSCTAPNFLQAVQGSPYYGQYKMVAEPCESSCFSWYCNVDGTGFPCSFSEGVVPGVDMVRCSDFLKDVWNAQETTDFRRRLMENKDTNGCRRCPIYSLEVKNEG